MNDFLFIDRFQVEITRRGPGWLLGRARYEGTYVWGTLCCVHARFYWRTANPPSSDAEWEKWFVGELRGRLEEEIHSLRAIGHKTVLLPDYHCVGILAGRGPSVVGYFGREEILHYWSMERPRYGPDELKQLAPLFDHLHSRGLGHGSLSPVSVSLNGGAATLACPFLPLHLPEGAEWDGWDPGGAEERIRKDRTAFAVMMMDALTGTSDAAQFHKRAANVEHYKPRFPETVSVLSRGVVSCSELAEASEKDIRDRIKRQERRRKTRRRIFGVAVAIILLAVLYWVVITIGAKLARMMLLEGDIEGARRWAGTVVALHPNSQLASEIERGVRSLRLEKALNTARAAAEKRQWAQCHEAAQLALALEPAHDEAQKLSEIARRAIIYESGLTKINDLISQRNWSDVVTVAKGLLPDAPPNDDRAERVLALAEANLCYDAAIEALENGNFQEAARQIAAAERAGLSDDAASSFRTNMERRKKAAECFAEAKAAAESGNWRRSKELLATVLSLAPDHAEASRLQERVSLEREIEKLLNAARAAIQSGDWQLCKDNVTRALAMAPNNDAAQDMLRQANFRIAMAQAQDAVSRRQWQLALGQAKTALEYFKNDANAIAIRDRAEREIKVRDLLLAARRARQQQRWEDVLAAAKEILALQSEVPENIEEARELQRVAMLEIEAAEIRNDPLKKKLKLEKDLQEARRAHRNKLWELSLRHADSILSIDPENKEAQELKAESSYQLGLAALKAGRFDEAARYFESASDLDHTGAKYELGRLYAKGSGRIENMSKAVELYSAAASRGHADAAYQLAVHYMYGLGVTENPAQAVRWLKLAADKRHGFAIYTLGSCHERGYGVVQDLGMALHYYRLAAAMKVSGANEKVTYVKELMGWE